MKKIIQLLYILFAVAAFSACSDDNQGEVVSQDLSYQLDANYVFVDIPEKLKGNHHVEFPDVFRRNLRKTFFVFNFGRCGGCDSFFYGHNLFLFAE